MGLIVTEGTSLRWYALPADVITKCFEDNSRVCKELLPEVKRILERVQEEYKNLAPGRAARFQTGPSQQG